VAGLLCVCALHMASFALLSRKLALVYFASNPTDKTSKPTPYGLMGILQHETAFTVEGTRGISDFAYQTPVMLANFRSDARL